jgi:hypothetical protein
MPVSLVGFGLGRACIMKALFNHSTGENEQRNRYGHRTLNRSKSMNENISFRHAPCSTPHALCTSVVINLFQDDTPCSLLFALCPTHCSHRILFSIDFRQGMEGFQQFFRYRSGLSAADQAAIDLDDRNDFGRGPR